MRIHLLSDLHLELQAWEPTVRDADVTILAGDIHKGDRVMAWARAHFSGPVLVVAGNHEFYGGHLENRSSTLRQNETSESFIAVPFDSCYASFRL